MNRHRQIKKHQCALSRGASKTSSSLSAGDQAGVDYLDLPLEVRATLGSDDRAAAVAAVATADAAAAIVNTPSAKSTSTNSSNSSGTETISIDQLGMELGMAGMEGIAGITVDAGAAAAANMDTFTGELSS